MRSPGELGEPVAGVSRTPRPDRGRRVVPARHPPCPPPPLRSPRPGVDPPRTRWVCVVHGLASPRVAARLAAGGTGMARRKRMLGRALALLGGAAIALTAVLAVFADGGALNVEVPDRHGYAADFTDDGAKVEYIGDLNTTFGSSGSGVFDAFVRLQAEPQEAGYNTDGGLGFNTKYGNFTHP